MSIRWQILCSNHFHKSEHVWALSAALFYWFSSQRTLVHKAMSSQTSTKLLQLGMSLWGSLEKDTDRMCPSSHRKTWSSDLNNTASQLFQVVSQRTHQRGLVWMASKRLGSPSQVGQKSETVAWTPATTLLSLYWLKTLFNPGDAHFLDKGNEQCHHRKVASPTSIGDGTGEAAWA